MLGQYAFRVKLDAPNGILFMANTHDLPLVGFGGDFEAVRERFALYDERMIACGVERARHALEQVLAIVADGRCLAMHHPVIDDDICAESMPDALMAEAHPEQWNFRAKCPNDVVGQSRLARGTRSWRNKNALRTQGANLVYPNSVVAVDL